MSKKSRKANKNYVKAVKMAYNALVDFRKYLEGRGIDRAAEIEDIYKQLWCECLDEEPPF